MSRFKLKEENEFDIDLKPIIVNSPLNLIYEEDLLECMSTTETNITNADQVECHIYYPDAADTANEVSNQEDPLGDTSEWTSYEPINVDGELINLENMTPSNVSDSFSIVDLLEIGESKPIIIKTEPIFEIGSDGTKPSIAQLQENTKKRKSPPDSHDVAVPSKRINLRNNPHSFKYVLKELKVNIGPKLPLPKCLLLKMISEKVKKTSEVMKCPSCDFSCQETNELNDHVKEHIVLKIFICTRCNHKCTDSLSHETHVANCLVGCSDSVVDQLNVKNIPHKGYYRCEVCSFKFKNEQNFIVHINKHPKDEVLKCYICQMGFSSADRLRDHMKLDHNATEMIFSCNICQYSSVKCQHFKNHLVTHNVDKYLFCSRCKKNFEDLTEINEHLRKTHKNSAPRIFDNGIKDQIVKDNSIVEDEITKLKSNFMSKNILENEFYKCNGCSYKFLELENLLTHKKLHLDISTPYKCSDCDFESYCVLDINKHLSTHSQPEVTVICNVCKVLLSGRKIKPHAVFHVSDGLFCFSCFENYENHQVYEQHLNSIHNTTLDKVLTCSECSYKHTNSRVLKIHKNRYHNKNRQQIKTKSKNNKNSVPERNLGACVFKCNKCNHEFSQIDKFEKHEKLKHGGYKDLFVCSVCNWTTCLYKFYLRHMTTHGGKNSYLCCYCQCKIYKECDFIKHILEHTVKCCPYCVFKCENFVSLRRHFSRHHMPGNGRYSCRLCPYNNTKMSSLSNHSIMYHPKEFPSLRLPIPLRLLSSTNGCGLCPFVTYESYDLKRHISRHYMNNSVKKANNSDQPASASTTLQCSKEKTSTQIILSGRWAYHCSQCLYSSKNRNSVSKHLVNKHNIQGGTRNNMILRVNNSNNDTSKKNAAINFPKKKSLIVKQRFKPAVKNTLQRRKSHACNICSYTSYCLHDLKKHKVKHFTGGSLKKKYVQPFADQIKNKSKNSTTSQSIECHDDIKKTSQINKDESAHYSCSQCTFKSENIKTVTLHLLDIHNIYGSLKNHMVLKVNGKQMQISNKSILDTENETSLGKALQENCVSKPKKVRVGKSISTGLEMKKIPQSDDNREKCLQCNVHLLSTRAQIEHKSLGHVRFWDKPFSCTKPKCGVRFTTKQSLVRHEMHRCTKISTVNNNVTAKKQNSNNDDHPVKEERSAVPDEDSFSCGECDYVTCDVTDFIKHMFIHTGIPDD